MRQPSTESSEVAPIVMPLVPPAPGSGPITRLRRVTTRPAAAMLIALPPTATTLPTEPGVARIVTDLATLTVLVL
jgi:hypothetical protein